MAVPVTRRPTFAAGKPGLLFRGRFQPGAAIRSYDVARDGQRFLMVLPKDRPPISPREMVFVENWLEELKQRVPTK
jgi:hypothetical protein